MFYHKILKVFLWFNKKRRIFNKFTQFKYNYRVSFLSILLIYSPISLFAEPLIRPRPIAPKWDTQGGFARTLADQTYVPSLKDTFNTYKEKTPRQRQSTWAMSVANKALEELEIRLALSLGDKSKGHTWASIDVLSLWIDVVGTIFKTRNTCQQQASAIIQHEHTQPQRNNELQREKKSSWLIWWHYSYKDITRRK